MERHPILVPLGFFVLTWAALLTLPFLFDAAYAGIVLGENPFSQIEWQWNRKWHGTNPLRLAVVSAILALAAMTPLLLDVPVKNTSRVTGDSVIRTRRRFADLLRTYFW